jgi:radical SAM superfamily enzyme YgiQ (UPF0313 family)
MPSQVLLINSNEMRPPVAPIALDYVGGALAAAGYRVACVDLAFASDIRGAIGAALDGGRPLLTGISFRNTDDCFWPSGAWFVPRLGEIVAEVRRATPAPIVLGGCGFSIFPRRIMAATGADFGIAGDGEAAVTALARRLEEGGSGRGVPGVACRNGDGTITVAPPAYPTSLSVPVSRSHIDNPRYLREGGMGGLETKRGCPGQCIYCADPIGKGARARCRPPAEVADEAEALLAQGVDVVHLCDSEFNLPPEHATAVCDEFRDRDLGRRLRWYCYAAVSPFSPQLARRMRAAGCAGINFGADSGSDRMLAALGRPYRGEAVTAAVAACRQAGITVMLDLLIGAPGEDEASVRESIELVKAADPCRAGAAVGVRVYPGTPLARIVRQQGPMDGNPNLRGHVRDNDDFFRPVFHVDRRLGQDPGGLVAAVIGRDDRFFQPAAATEALDYNYNANEILERAIAAGERGAFWDILRRL